MEITDFVKSDIYDYEGDLTIWGVENEIGVECYGSTLEAILPKINLLIQRLEGGRAKVLQALLAKDYLSLAEDWASSAEEDEESEQECYIMEDGTRVYLPITEEAFAQSLRFGGLSVYFDKDTDDISASLYLLCEPDYFADHCIQIYLDGEFNVDVNGLAG